MDPAIWIVGTAVALLAGAVAGTYWYTRQAPAAQARIAAEVQAGAQTLLTELRPLLLEYLTTHPGTATDLDARLQAFGASLPNPYLRDGYAALYPFVRQMALDALAAPVPPHVPDPTPRKAGF